jgi:hypothetical protein
MRQLDLTDLPTAGAVIDCWCSAVRRITLGDAVRGDRETRPSKGPTRPGRCRTGCSRSTRRASSDYGRWR